MPYKAYTVPTYHIGLGHEWQVVPVLHGVQLRQRRGRGHRYARRWWRWRWRRRCCSLVCQHLRHCFIGTHFWYWSLGTSTTMRRQATPAHPSKKAKGVYLIAKELKIHFYEFATCNKTIENDDKSTWSTLVPFSAKKLRKKTQGSRSCKDTVTGLEVGNFHLLCFLQSCFILIRSWWLSSVRFKYKPGYKPCDLL